MRRYNNNWIKTALKEDNVTTVVQFITEGIEEYTRIAGKTIWESEFDAVSLHLARFTHDEIEPIRLSDDAYMEVAIQVRDYLIAKKQLDFYIGRD